MTSQLLYLWAVTGGAVATVVMMLIWLPDPPPGVSVKFLGILSVGIVTGLVGGILNQQLGIHSSDPMPATVSIVASAALSLVVSGGLGIFSGGRAQVG